MNSFLETEGPAAPPRSNGELIFAEPWESRAFGMAVTLNEANVFSWTEFQAALIARISAWEAEQTEGQTWNYYREWLAALEDLLVDRGRVSRHEMLARAEILASRPADHGHRDADNHSH